MVVCLLVLLAMMAMAGYLMSSGTGRVYGRTLNARLALEAADAALSEAVGLLRVSLDTGQAIPPACPDNWRALLLEVLAAPTNKPTGRKISPLKAREVFREETPEMLISDVGVEIVGAYSDETAADGDRGLPPQGVIEMVVTVKGTHKSIRVERRMRQRRVIWAGPVPAFARVNVSGPPPIVFTLLTHPLGTVIE